MHKHSLLTTLLSERAASQSAAPVFTYISREEKQTITFQELEIRSKIIATKLTEMEMSQKNVLLLFSSGLEFIYAFYGCLYAQAIAVPAPPPKRNRALGKVGTIIREANIQLILTDQQISQFLDKKLEEENLGYIQSLDVASILQETTLSALPAWHDQKINKRSLAFLQYSSGSTGKPKGVMVTHENIYHNQKIIQKAFHSSDQSIGVAWLPFYHDMGLIGCVIHPVFVGFECILMSPMDFLQNPYLWLKTISDHQGTMSGGPNFAYNYCVQQVTEEQVASLDLSAWHTAFNGAEPVHAASLTAFADKFAPAKFRKSAFLPCYGMAEATLMVSGVKDQNRNPTVCEVNVSALEQGIIQLADGQKTSSKTKDIVSCGKPHHLKVMVVNPKTLTPTGEGEIGEIWVSGQSITRGYWNEKELTKETFRAYIKESGKGPFLRTGDLGFIRNEEVFITGRLKNLIIIAGRNLYPQDIEFELESHVESLQSEGTAAFSITKNQEEKLVIVSEIKRTSLRNIHPDKVFEDIRQVVSEQFDVQIFAILLINPGALPKTSSGKKQRVACQQAFESGSMASLYSWSQKETNSHLPEKDMGADASGRKDLASDIQQWLVHNMAKHLQVDPAAIELSAPLEKYGLSSFTAVKLSHELSKKLGQKISPTIIYDYPSINALVKYFSSGPSKDAVFSSENGSKPSLSNEPVAIIGMQVRFPGAPDINAYWEMLVHGKNGIQNAPPERPSADTAPFSDGTPLVKWGGYLEKIDQFDPHFFDISPAEAPYIDPQQRLILEVSWEALENGGIVPANLSGKNVGVFIGVSNYDYASLRPRSKDRLSVFMGTGNALSIVANRLSYFLDLKGPSMAIDTACSSSLVAIHQACQSLKNHESTMAIAGGVNLIFDTDLTWVFQEAGMLAKDGKCKTLDARADGYVRGEGCGVVILKRLADAIQDQDNIWAVIKGSAINQDGKSNGLTAPNGLSQKAVIQRALKNAGIKANSVGFWEIHGSGTSLGDPIEINALKSLIETNPPGQPTQWIGTAKTNIGHLESAAGVAGLIKTVLAIQHNTVPPHLHFESLNPEISLEGSPFKIPLQPEKWETKGTKRHAGVSSFGFGGTNAHVILEEPPVIKNSLSSNPLERTHHILCLSAKNQEALRHLSSRYHQTLQSLPDEHWKDLAFSGNAKRSHFGHRVAIVASSRQQALEKLQAFAQDTFEFQPLIKSNKIAFLISGQGSQYSQMGKTLYETQPQFKTIIDTCHELLLPLLPTPLLDVLYKAENQHLLKETIYTQPAVFSINYALAKLWQSWGIQPDYLIGHSVGEYTAACLAGVFTLAEALPLIAHRAKLMQDLPTGKMAAIFAENKVVEQAIATESQVSIAAYNFPGQVVISGETGAIDRLLERFKQEGLAYHPLQVSHAFHSAMMEPMLGPFESFAQKIDYKPPQIPVISNITGDIVPKEGFTATYWKDHISAPVRFMQSMKALAEKGCNIFLEVSPTPILTAMGKSCLPNEHPSLWLNSLQPKKQDWDTLLNNMGSLYQSGIACDWEAFDKPYARKRIDLPTYPFQKKSYWIENMNPDHPTDEKNTLSQYLSKDSKSLIEKLKGAGSFNPEEIELSEKIITTLAHQLHAEKVATSIQQHFYEVQWKELPYKKVQPHPASVEKYWVIFSSQLGIEEPLAGLLEKHGNTCIFIHPGTGFRQTDEKTFTINPREAEDYQKIWDSIASVNGNHPIGILHLWSLQPPFKENLQTEFILDQMLLGYGSLLHITQTRLKYSTKSLPRLLVVTQSAQHIRENDPPIQIVSSPVNGFLKTLVQEYPEWQHTLIDLDEKDDHTHQAQRIYDVLEGNDLEKLIAFRLNKKYTARLIQKKLETQNPSPIIQRDAFYMITGGCGTLGLQTAQWLIEKGACKLILVGRSGATSKAAQAKIELWKKQGLEIVIMQADVSSYAELKQVFDEIAHADFHLKGIFHLAGRIADGIIVNQNWDTFQKVADPKISGTWHLHLLSKNIELDYFVCFSSVSSLLGSAGQANYAAANAFLDALAIYRKQQGLPATSIQWGPWHETMMATQFSEGSGLQKIHASEGLVALEHIVAMQLANIGFMPIQWENLFHQIKDQPFFEAILQTHADSLSPIPDYEKTTSHLLNRLKTAHAKKQVEILNAFIEKEIIRGLGLDQHSLDYDQGFADLGINSLLAVELKNKLQKELNCQLSTTVFFNYATIKDLTHYLLHEVLQLELPVSRPSKTDLQISSGQKDLSHSTLTEPVAIIGIGCKFPGGVDDLTSYWRVLSEGWDTIGEVPADRWDVNEYYHPDPSLPGKIITRYGGFIENIAAFDPSFFGISPREALSMDPQHRLLLEVCWKALEHAGIPADKHLHEHSGIFIGIGPNEYAQASYSGKSTAIDAYLGMGNGTCFSSGRISHILGFQGPSMAIDTACSSSLVSLHLACQSLRSGECDLALAGGVQLIISPETNIFLSKAHALSPEGRCKTFSQEADGYVRGEGCGMVVLKRLSSAVKDQDNILAVVRGSAVNHDGHSSGLTVPNGKSQESVIRQAIRVSNIDPLEVGYIEAHGTGTPLGDPIEIEAIQATYGQNREKSHPLWVGSVKTNVGHLEAAAGVAGLIKVVLAIQHKQIPPNLHFQTPNPNINWKSLSIKVPQKLQPWPPLQDKYLAGVSSFGLSGTNAHLILEAPPVIPSKAEGHPFERPGHVLCLSAKHDNTLKELAKKYDTFLEALPEDTLKHLAFATNTGRTHFSHRLALKAHTVSQVRKQLQAFYHGEEESDVKTRIKDPAIAFMFSDLNAFESSVCRELYRTHPYFQSIFHQCDEIVKPTLSVALSQVVFNEQYKPQLPYGRYQPIASFVVQFAIAKLWQSWNVHPDYLYGYGSGELVAACVAEVISLEEALGLLVSRTPLLSDLHASQTNLNEFDKLVSNLHCRKPQIPIFSITRGQILQQLTEAYLKEILKDTAHNTAIPAKTFLKTDCNIFLEMYPMLVSDQIHTFLSSQPNPYLWLRSLQAPSDPWNSILDSLAALYRTGIDIDWKAFDQPYARIRVDLPHYPFLKQDYWLKDKGEPEFPKNCLYQIQWKPQDVKPPAEKVWKTNIQDTHWILFGNQDELNRSFLHFFHQNNGHGTIVKPGDEARFDAWEGEVVVRPTVLSDFTHLFEKLSGNTPSLTIPLQIIFMWGMPENEEESISFQTLQAAQERNLAGLLHMIQAIQQTKINPLPKIWLLTKESIPHFSLPTPLSVLQSALVGMAKSINLEYPEIWGGNLDVDALFLKDFPRNFMQEVYREGSRQDHHIAFRGNKMYVPRLTKTEENQSKKRFIQLHPEKSYLLTGGLGNIGLHVAKWLVKNGAKHLIFISRSGASSAKSQKVLAELNEQKIHTTVWKADVSQASEVKQALDQIQHEHPILGGIVHLAGLKGYRTLDALDIKILLEMLAPKLFGAWWLHHFTRHVNLDFFVSFSSIAAAWGSRGQAHYAAANQALDVFMAYRNALGLPSMSINWGLWEDEENTQNQWNTLLDQVGIKPLPPSQALQALNILWQEDQAQHIVADIHWNRFKNLFAIKGKGAFFEEITDAFTTVEKENGDVPESPIVQALKNLPVTHRKKHLIQFLQQQVAQVTGYPSHQLPDIEQGLFEIGMDSIMAVELKAQLEKSFHKVLPSTMAFDFPTIAAIANHLMDKVIPLEFTSATDTAKPYKVSATEDGSEAGEDINLDEMSEDQIEALLEEELRKSLQ